MIHGDRLHAPAALRALTPLMVEDRLSDFQGLKNAVNARVDGSGGLLYRYSGNWWNDFSVAAAPYPQTAEDVIAFWRAQYPSLPVPTVFPPLDALNVNALSGIELYEAYAVGQDAIMMLQKDIDRCVEHTRELAKTIKATEELRQELRDLEEKEVANIARREISEAMESGGNTRDP